MLGYVVAFVVGFSCFSTYVVVRVYRCMGIYEDPDMERDVVARIFLIKFVDQVRIKVDFARLGLERVVDLLVLSGEGLRRCYGFELYRLFRMARGELEAPDEAFRITE